MLVNFTVRIYREDDYEEYKILYETVYKTALNERRFDNSHYNNPNYSGRALIFLACNPDGKIIGANSFYPERVRFEGREYDVAQSGDSIVLEEYRGLGVFLSLLNESALVLATEGYALAFGFAGPSSYPGFRKAGYTDLEEIRSYMKILNYSLFLSRRFQHRHVARTLGKAIDLYFRYRYRGSSLECADYPITGFHDEIADFSSPVTGRAHLVKDNNYFQWKYRPVDDFSYRAVTIYKRKRPIAKFIVREASTGDYSVGRVIDYRFVEPDWSVESIKCLARLYRDKGFYALHTWEMNDQGFATGWQKNRAFSRPNSLFLVIKSLRETDQLPSDPEKWRFVPADADTT